jgi:serine phosphatase RsbU (regulator of sigma subunit)/HAMP domain-containing protein
MGRRLSSSKRRSGSISSNILRVTLAVGVLVIAAAAAVALYTTSRLSASLVSAEERGQLQAVRQLVQTRFQAVDQAAERTAAAAAGPSPTGTALDAALAAGRGWADLTMVVDVTGKAMAMAPTGTPVPPGVDAIVEKGLTEGLVYVEVPQKGQLQPRVWVARAVGLPDGRVRIALVRLKNGFGQEALAAYSAGPNLSALLIAPGKTPRLVGSVGPKVRMNSLAWKGSSLLGGDFSIRRADGDLLLGYVEGVPGAPGLTWRVAVAQPATSAIADTLGVVSPLLAVLVVGGIAALAVAWALSARLVAPLRTLESSALQAAAGAYVQPLAVSRDDEVGRVAEAFNAVALRLNALHDVTQLLASASRPETVFDGVLTAIPHIVGPGVTALYLLDDEGEWLQLTRTRGVVVGSVHHVAAQGGGWLAGTLHSSGPVPFEGDPTQLAENLGGLDLPVTGRAVACPLAVGTRPLGVVVVVPEAERPLDEGQLEMLRTFSAQAAVAVNTSRLFAQESEARALSDGLRAIAEELARPGALSDGLDRVAEILKELLGAAWVRFALADREITGLAPVPDPGEEAALLRVARSAAKRAPADRRSLLLLRDADPLVAGLLEAYGGHSILLAPIGLEGDHGAVLVVALNATELQPGDLAVTDAVADEVALALDNAYLYGRAVTRAANLETVFRISQVVGSSLNVNVVLNRVLDVVQKIFNADAVALMTYDPVRRVITSDMARGLVPSAVLELEVRPGEDVPGYVFASGEPAVFRDLHGDMGGLPAVAAQSGLRSLIAVPLLARGHSIGVLIAFSEDVAAFTEEDVSLLRTFASQAALAVDTARMYSREHRIAHRLQTSIRPEQLPEFPGLETGTAYVPAAAPDAEIGGDFYDMMAGPDGRPFVVIGDVAGKGIEAATKTSMIRYSVRALVAAGFSPAMVLAELNRLVCATGEPSDIVTLWVGAVETDAGRVVWADGGHPPGLVRRANGQTDLLGPTGPLLGAISTAEYDERACDLDEGDLLVLYTDGVTEARRGNKFFGDERLRESLVDEGSAQDVADRVLGDVRRFVRGDLRDDVAVLAVMFAKRTTKRGRRGAGTR